MHGAGAVVDSVVSLAPRKRRRERHSLGVPSRVVKQSLPIIYDEGYPLDAERPRTRGDCQDGPRPCPWVSCRHHLYADTLPSGNLKLNFPDKEPWELEHTCSLDVADDGGTSLEQVGVALNLVRERVRQIEVIALTKLGVTAGYLK
jgi:hypothetical protein